MIQSLLMMSHSEQGSFTEPYMTENWQIPPKSNQARSNYPLCCQVVWGPAHFLSSTGWSGCGWGPGLWPLVLALALSSPGPSPHSKPRQSKFRLMRNKRAGLLHFFMDSCLILSKLIQIYFTHRTPELVLIFKLSRDHFRNEKKNGFFKSIDLFYVSAQSLSLSSFALCF